MIGPVAVVVAVVYDSSTAVDVFVESFEFDSVSAIVKIVVVIGIG